jgi:two-component system, OmpR family, response regulator
MGTKVQTAMIIDDDEDLGKLLAHILEERKIHVLTVHSLTEAEAYLTYLKPTVIFLDNSFPEGLGINFIKSIRSADDEIKIIMMTADTAVWIEQKAMDEGVSFFLKKPFSKKLIDTTLDQLNFRRKNA